MPERAERLLWVYGRSIDNVRQDIEAALQATAAAWTEYPVTVHACVDTPASIDRLWLFRLQHGIGNNGVAERFTTMLAADIEQTKARLHLAKDQLKRRTNFPTPLVQPTPERWPRTDLGLHPVNDRWNGMLVTFSYNEGRFLHPPHMQLVTLRLLADAIGAAWSTFACGCRQPTATCCREGCYDCFRADCPNCDGTGWKAYARWRAGGFKVDYSQRFHPTKRFPVAITSSLDDQINRYLQASFTPAEVHALKVWLDACSEPEWQASASSLKIAATGARQSANGQDFTLDVRILPNGEPQFRKVILS